ncbi:MAG: carbon starvation CstA family protein [Flavobacteriales bacterium]
MFLSTRRDGKSLGEMVRMELGKILGLVVSVGILLIIIILLIVLALVVVNALVGIYYRCNHSDCLIHGDLW